MADPFRCQFRFNDFESALVVWYSKTFNASKRKILRGMLKKIAMYDEQLDDQELLDFIKHDFIKKYQGEVDVEELLANASAFIAARKEI